MIITQQAYAKVNLTLDILGRRPDGYHELEMVMQTVSLCDTVTVEASAGGGIGLSWSLPVPHGGAENSAVKAAEAFFAKTGIENPGLKMHLEKRIPMQAGLGGGSADAAAVLRGLGELFGAAEDDLLCGIGAQVGADVPFCVRGGTALARGVGEALTPLPCLPDCHVVLAQPGAGVSTAAAYRAFDAFAAEHSGRLARPDTHAMVSALERRDLRAAAANLCNVFEQALDIPDSVGLKAAMLRAGALGAVLTGSGSAVFGLFDDDEKAGRCRELLSSSGAWAVDCGPVSL